MLGVTASELGQLAAGLGSEAFRADVRHAVNVAVHADFVTTAAKSFGSNRSSFFPIRTSGINPSLTQLRKVGSDTPKNSAACFVVNNFAGESMSPTGVAGGPGVDAGAALLSMRDNGITFQSMRGHRVCPRLGSWPR